MNYLLLLVVVVFIVFVVVNRYGSRMETFRCYPDLFEKNMGVIRMEKPYAEIERRFMARGPTISNKSIVPVHRELPGTIYYSAYPQSYTDSADNQDADLVGLLKMCPSESFVSVLLDVCFVNQELFGFSGWYGYHVYELDAFSEDTIMALVHKAIAQMKSEPNRYYISILCRSERLAKMLMDHCKFIMSVKDNTHRFSKDTLYTMIYYK